MGRLFGAPVAGKTLLLLSALTAAGCNGTTKVVPVNLDYASTSLGYRNSGLLEPGSLFLWDTQENELVLLTSDVVVEERKPNTKTSIEAKNIRGIQIGAEANLPAGVSGEIKAAIRNNYVFVVSNATKATSLKRFTAISNAYRALGAAGHNPFDAWRIDQLAGNPQRYKLVLAESPVYAESESLQFLSGGDGSISVNSPTKDNASFTVKAPRESTAKCSGTPALCFINLFVMDVSLKDDQDANGNPVKNLNYRPSLGIDREKLPDALRKRT